MFTSLLDVIYVENHLFITQWYQTLRVFQAITESNELIFLNQILRHIYIQLLTTSSDVLKDEIYLFDHNISGNSSDGGWRRSDQL